MPRNTTVASRSPSVRQRVKSRATPKRKPTPRPGTGNGIYYVRKHKSPSSFVDPSSPAAKKAKLVSQVADPAERTKAGTAYIVRTRRGKKRVWIRPEGFGRKADGSGPGVKPGHIGAKTKEMKQMIQLRGPELVQRLFQLAFGHDLPTAHNACKTLMAYGYGRPTVHVELERGADGRSYIAEMPPPISHEQWMANMHKTYGPQVIDVTQSSSSPASPPAPSPPIPVATNGHGSMNGNGHP